MGEAYASEMKFDQAIAAYNQVIQNYPNGDQVPMAYYKRGLAQNRLGQVDAARASWEMVIKLLPSNRSEVALAQQNLDRIKREQQAKPQ
jgi:TolA-binding protein